MKQSELYFFLQSNANQIINRIYLKLKTPKSNLYYNACLFERGSYYVVQGDLELMILLPLPFKAGILSMYYHAQILMSSFLLCVCECVYVCVLMHYTCSYAHTYMCVNVCEGQGSVGAFRILLF